MSGISFQRRDRAVTPEARDSESGPTKGKQPLPIWRSVTSRRAFSRLPNRYKILGAVVVVLILYMFLEGRGNRGDGYDRFAKERLPNVNTFVDFEGGLDCGLSSQDLYVSPPQSSSPLAPQHKSPFCKDRSSLLKSLSEGGRHGFDTPFSPNDCSYKWYTTTEICIILDRFDGIAFVGDGVIASIYAAFNMLLRRNLAVGALEQWRMSDRELEQCRCRHQFDREECAQFYVTSSETVVRNDPGSGLPSPYICNRSPHFYYRINGPAPQESLNSFHDYLDQNPSSWKPVPIIHSVGISHSFNWQIATDSMDEWLTIADLSGRNTPLLWIGPNAAGHLKSPYKIMQEGNNALWYYTALMRSEAQRRGCEALDMYNMTIQATSFDGNSYDERVALVQAMMVINWLAKVDAT